MKHHLHCKTNSRVIKMIAREGYEVTAKKDTIGAHVLGNSLPKCSAVDIPTMSKLQISSSTENLLFVFEKVHSPVALHILLYNIKKL